MSSVTIKNDQLINYEYMAEDKLKGLGNVMVGIQKAHGKKCARCWNYR